MRDVEPTEWLQYGVVLVTLMIFTTSKLSIFHILKEELVRVWPVITWLVSQARE